MDITKYSHACFSVTKAGKTLIVDPGNWTHDLTIPDTVSGVIVTHEHADHCDTTLLARIIEKNPSATVFAHQDVTSRLTGFSVQPVKTGETVNVEDFVVDFVGDKHATIDDTMPPLANLGVVIDDYLYYPGDSFVVPDRTIDTLAVPAAAPWMKYSEAAAFLRAIKPRMAFPTHDAILSDTGKQLADMMLGTVCQDIGTEYRRLH